MAGTNRQMTKTHLLRRVLQRRVERLEREKAELAERVADLELRLARGEGGGIPSELLTEIRQMHRANGRLVEEVRRLHEDNQRLERAVEDLATRFRSARSIGAALRPSYDELEVRDAPAALPQPAPNGPLPTIDNTAAEKAIIERARKAIFIRPAAGVDEGPARPAAAPNASPEPERPRVQKVSPSRAVQAGVDLSGSRAAAGSLLRASWVSVLVFASLAILLALTVGAIVGVM